jgi:hypothetical protein
VSGNPILLGNINPKPICFYCVESLQSERIGSALSAKNPAEINTLDLAGFDENTNLYNSFSYEEARYYDPTIGRFINVELAGLSDFEPDWKSIVVAACAN